MRTLDEICNANNTDKGSVHPNPHDYAWHYDSLFWEIRHEPIKLLEIGVADGGSMKSWLEYFPNGRIYGVDITPGRAFQDERYTQAQGDQNDPAFWAKFTTDHGADWDVIIDDGSHFSGHVITSFSVLWPFVKLGGLYCVEDLFCSYVPMYCTPGLPPHSEFLNGLVKDMHHGCGMVDEFHFFRELVVMRKKRR